MEYGKELNTSNYQAIILLGDSVLLWSPHHLARFEHLLPSTTPSHLGLFPIYESRHCLSCAICVDVLCITHSV